MQLGGERIKFSEVAGLTRQNQVVEYREGADPGSSHRMPGLGKHSNIVLRRGVAAGNNGFLRWLSTVRPNMVERRDLVISLMDGEQRPAKNWKVLRAVPVRIEGPALKASGNEVAIESIEFAHERLEVPDGGEPIMDGDALPARLMRSEREWDDLVLPDATIEQLEEVTRCIR